MGSSPSIQQLDPPPQPPPPQTWRLSPSDQLELTSSLEFLTCLNTEETIPLHKIHDVVIPYLLRNLSKCIDPLLSSPDHDPLSPLHAMCEEVHSELSQIKETFERLKEWEGRLNTLTRSLMLYDWEAVFNSEGTESVEVLHTAIPDIGKMVSALKLQTRLPLETDLVDRSSNSPSSSNLNLSRRVLETAFFNDFQARYESLEFQQKQSLLYFSIFPESGVIRRKVLTYLWVGEGLIESIGDITWEQVAHQMFDELAAKGFIVPVEEKDIGDFSVFMIDPLVRSALITLAKNTNFVDFDSDGNPTVDFTRCGRSCLQKMEGGSSEQLRTFANHDKLLTLFNVNENCLDFPRGWLSKAKNVRVIHLGNWGSSSTDNCIEAEDERLLEDLGHARLLRCLSLNGVSGIKMLPDSISKLENLNILDVKSCRDLEKLPRQISLMRKLTHLDMSGCYLLDKMPYGLTHLTELRVLKGFVIRNYTRQCSLYNLVNLKKLRKLGLYADRETTGENGELNCLSKFEYLKVLTISWTVPSKSNMPSFPFFSLFKQASRSLPTSLEKLDLRCWPSSTMPSWVKPWELNSLRKLYIRGGQLVSLHTDQSEALWTVRILRLKFLRELKTDWKEVNKMFPSLVYLEKVDCPGLSSFPFEVVWKLEAGTSR